MERAVRVKGAIFFLLFGFVAVAASPSDTRREEEKGGKQDPDGEPDSGLDR